MPPYIGFFVCVKRAGYDVRPEGYFERTDFENHASAIEFARWRASEDTTVWVELSGVHKDNGLVRLMFISTNRG